MNPRVLLICAAPIGPRMAGPAIRYVQMARVLCEHVEVCVAAPNAGRAPQLPQAVAVHDFDRLPDLLRDADVVVSQGVGPCLPALADCRAMRVFDLYDPVHIEAAAYFAHETGGRAERIMMLQLRALLRWGDYFLCASPRQRDLWLGLMSADRDALAEWTRDADPLARFLTVPFGVDPQPPQPAEQPVLRGRLPNLSGQSLLLLWNGGIWNWLDPLLAIRATAGAARTGADVHLVFMGGPARELMLPAMRIARAAVDEARALRVLDRNVHFLSEWTPYDQRGPLLLECDALVSTGPAGLEHHFACRTRLLDAIWAGRAAVCTAGEVVAEQLAQAGAAEAVAPGDLPALTASILRLAGDRGRVAEMGQRAASLREAAAWPRVMEPLVSLCRTAGGAGSGGSAPRGRGERRWYETRLFAIRQIERWEHWSGKVRRQMR